MRRHTLKKKTKNRFSQKFVKLITLERPSDKASVAGFINVFLQFIPGYIRIRKPHYRFGSNILFASD